MTRPPQLDPRWILTRAPELPTQDERNRAIRCVTAHATSADDCAELLDMLGLTPPHRHVRPVQP
ncbi:hypothetical protein SAMN05421805_104206 [Saccharopolyspora antimicrobica]|uniref:Uncharacterized protein n=1 Tax=Saccharopolyspora antimicrobica TaxID=455193 RepID=A0A1I4YNE2_9PSEU|nr:hypothetical protein [Saccharopolyspora antimicrobica]RKT82735.1 hypothetical protein ATL45_0990 [Saccharopolyspora antimicrobica]SFN39109.1 hypothetical protein SAMN05421805_104206 [Saccharopolyspora antimicrobica]